MFGTFNNPLSSPITFLIELLIAGIVVYAVYWFIDLLTLPAQIKTIIKVIIALLALLWLLGLLGFNIR